MNLAAKEVSSCGQNGEVSKIARECLDMLKIDIQLEREDQICSWQPNEVKILSKKLEMEIAENVPFGTPPTWTMERIYIQCTEESSSEMDRWMLSFCINIDYCSFSLFFAMAFFKYCISWQVKKKLDTEIFKCIQM